MWFRAFSGLENEPLISCATPFKIWFWTPYWRCRFFSVSVFRMDSELIVYDAIRSFPPDCMTENIGKFFGIGTSQITLLENVPNYIKKAYWNETKQSYQMPYFQHLFFSHTCLTISPGAKWVKKSYRSLKTQHFCQKVILRPIKMIY